MPITFLAGADNFKHCIFLTPYTATALYFNPGSIVELLVVEREHFAQDQAASIAFLNDHFPDQLLIRSPNPGLFRQGMPTSRQVQWGRFLETPVSQNQYTYISDIDLLFTVHRMERGYANTMAKTGLSYVNVLRAKKPDRMTGLMFVETKKYYDAVSKPIAARVSGGVRIGGSDEALLANLVREGGLRLPSILEFEDFGRYRPVPGVHTSLGRWLVESPHGSRVGGAGWHLHETTVRALKTLWSSDFWIEFSKTLCDDYFNNILLPLEAVVARGRFPWRSG